MTWTLLFAITGWLVAAIACLACYRLAYYCEQLKMQLARTMRLLKLTIPLTQSWCDLYDKVVKERDADDETVWTEVVE